MNEDSIINCHTHTFTGDHVPPYIAKTYVPTPFHLLLPLRMFVSLFRWWYKGPGKLKYGTAHKKWVKLKTAITAFFTRLFPLNVIAEYYIFFFAFFLLYSLFPVQDSGVSKFIYKIYDFTKPAFPTITATWMKVLIIAFVFIFFDSIRNLIAAIAQFIWKSLGKLPGKNTKEMVGRYLNIGRYAFHKKQSTILSKLKSQYPNGTGFVILPMDMDYMEAGRSNVRYRDQMQELAAIKNMPSNKGILFPFVFADPRRMVKVEDEKRYKKGDKEYFSWTGKDGKVELGDCFLKDYLIVHKFSGIKIYPALGYYPFDARLLPLWKYAADNNIPVLTHCIRGTIFFRGIKEHSWNAHPIFKQAMRKPNSDSDDGFKDDEFLEDEQSSDYIPLVLSQRKNVDFSYNFTNPMNYLCILEEELLRQVIGIEVKKGKGKELSDLFGYNGPDQPLTHNLKNLKICMGHFGGDDEWKKYFEKDRYNYSSQLTKNPSVGIKFFKTVKDKPAPGKPEQLWKYTDWYSIICSMILQYPKVYADISYILHGDDQILPLLEQTLKNPGLREKVLYGTDFFVVRNHKSDKNMLADMQGGLSPDDFKQIAVTNPRVYLSK